MGDVAAVSGVVLMTLGMVLLGRVVVLNVSQLWSPRWYERQLVLGPIALLLLAVGAVLAGE